MFKIKKFCKILNRPEFLMVFLALCVGILSDLGALLFRGLTGFVHNLLFSGRFSVFYNENLHTPPSKLAFFVIFVPVIGGLIVTWLIEHFANGEKGLSVPEIMYKIRRQNSVIQPAVGLSKTLAAAISIGSGASIGREGPVIQIGALISSLISDVFVLSLQQRKILLAAGAAASTAAMFNAPLAGIAFACELLLDSISLYSVLFIGISAITATIFNDIFFGAASIFTVQTIIPFKAYSMLLAHAVACIVIGILLGILSIWFIYFVYWCEDLFNAFKNPYWRHAIGMFMVGGMLYGFMFLFGHYYIEGVGFATIQDCLNGIITNPWLLILLIISKFLATGFSLGSGGSGGILSPSLFLGAVAGTAFGSFLHYLFPSWNLDIGLFAIAGMAGMVGSTTGAFITALLLTTELTHDFYSILPAIITVTTSFYIRKKLCPNSIYTLKFARQGIKLK